jgi:hypothetical protein
MDKYSEILSSFGTQETLNPEIWDDVESDEPKLKPQIRKALLMIAGEFMDFLGDDLFVDDVRFTGSLANYNWSKFSDIDLHLYLLTLHNLTLKMLKCIKNCSNLKKLYLIQLII